METWRNPSDEGSRRVPGSGRARFMRSSTVGISKHYPPPFDTICCPFVFSLDVRTDSLIQRVTAHVGSRSLSAPKQVIYTCTFAVHFPHGSGAR